MKIFINYIKKLVNIVDMTFMEYCGFQVKCIILTCLNTAMSILLPYFVSRSIDEIYIGKPGFLLCILIGIGVAMMMVEFYLKVFMARFSNELILRMKNKLYWKLNRTNGTFWDKHKTGDIFTVLQKDIPMLESLITSFIGDVLSNVLFFLGISIYILYTDFYSAVILLSSSFLCLFIQKRIGKKIEYSTFCLREKIGTQSAFLNETLNRMNSINVAGKSQTVYKYYCKSNREIVASLLEQAKLVALNCIVGTGYNILGIIIVVILGMVRGKQEGFSNGVWVSMLIFAQRLYAPIINLSNQYITIRKNLPIINKIYSVMYDENVIRSGKYDPKERLKGNITFEHVGFQYSEGMEEVLHDLNLSISSGEIIGITGENGSGKTTITKLLTRIYEPDNGAIYIDGRKLEEYSIEFLRKEIGYCEQDSYILSGSIEQFLMDDDYIWLNYFFVIIQFIFWMSPHQLWILKVKK